MRRHQFETYLDKVFDFSTRIAALPDGRKYSRHPGKKIFDAVFLGAACQFPALHRIHSGLAWHGDCGFAAAHIAGGVVAEENTQLRKTPGLPIP